MSKSKKVQTKHVLSFYWWHVRRYPWSIITTLLFVPLAVISNSIFPPLVLAKVLERLSTGNFALQSPLQSFQTELILYTGLIFASTIIFWRVVDYTVWKLEAKVMRNLAQQVFDHLIGQSADFHANNFTGSLVSQTNKLIGSYVRIADTSIFGVLPLLTTTIATACLLFSRARLFVVLLLLFSVIYIWVSYLVSKSVRGIGAKHAKYESKQTGYLADALTNVMAIKSFATEAYEHAGFAKATETTRSYHLKVMRAHQRQMLAFGTMTNTITAGALALAIVSVAKFGADFATAFLIFNYTAGIVTQLFQFSNQHIRNYNRAIGDADDMVRILRTSSEVLDPVQPQSSRLHRGGIVFDRVGFRHKDADSEIFHGLNVKIKPGEKVGLIGHSGSGKSTFVRLLLRFSDIQHGSIEIDGQNIAHIKQADLRRSIAYVPQEPLLFHRTIRENISYSRPDASLEEVAAVARKANAAEFIEKLPKGYDTMVGERGIKLSGGQRQRIAIARAMLKNAPILVLDEATSALDSESEALIQDALWKLMEGRTAIVIAHRLSTIQRMDRILVMDNGRIMEQGTHKELMMQNGIYAKLWQRQSGGFLDD